MGFEWSEHLWIPVTIFWILAGLATFLALYIKKPKWARDEEEQKKKGKSFVPNFAFIALALILPLVLWFISMIYILFYADDPKTK